MKKNLYLIGKSGLVSKYLKKNFKFKKIFSIKDIKKNHLKNVLPHDTIVLLSNPGGLNFCQNNKSEVKKFLNSIDILFNELKKETRIIFMSSDAVYNKKLEYGKMKLSIEKKISRKFKRSHVLRVCKIFSKNLNDKSEYTKIYNCLKKKKIVNVFTDQFCHYIEIKNLMKIFKKIINNKKNVKYGKTNIFDEKLYFSRYGFAKKIANKFLLEEKYLKTDKISSSNLPLSKRTFLKNSLKFF